MEEEGCFHGCVPDLISVPLWTQVALPQPTWLCTDCGRLARLQDMVALLSGSALYLGWGVARSRGRKKTFRTDPTLRWGAGVGLCICLLSPDITGYSEVSALEGASKLTPPGRPLRRAAHATK